VQLLREQTWPQSYEAAIFAVLSVRRPIPMMAKTRIVCCTVAAIALPGELSVGSTPANNTTCTHKAEDRRACYSCLCKNMCVVTQHCGICLVIERNLCGQEATLEQYAPNDELAFEHYQCEPNRLIEQSSPIDRVCASNKPSSTNCGSCFPLGSAKCNSVLLRSDLTRLEMSWNSSGVSAISPSCACEVGPLDGDPSAYHAPV
jgi:hypothetical protein